MFTERREFLEGCEFTERRDFLKGCEFTERRDLRIQMSYSCDMRLDHTLSPAGLLLSSLATVTSVVLQSR